MPSNTCSLPYFGMLEVYFIIKFLMDSLETYKSELFFNYFHKFTSLKVKISPKVYLKYTSYLEYRCIFKFSSISAEEDTNRSSHNLWSNDLVIGHRSTKPRTSGSKP